MNTKLRRILKKFNNKEYIEIDRLFVILNNYEREYPFIIDQLKKDIIKSNRYKDNE